MRYLWKQPSVSIQDREFILLTLYNYMMMSVVFLVWWLLPRAAIETGFLMPRRESESTSAATSALSYLYIFRNWWSYPTKPHIYSSKIIVQVLNMKSLSSPVVLWAQRDGCWIFFNVNGPPGTPDGIFFWGWWASLKALPFFIYRISLVACIKNKKPFFW